MNKITEYTKHYSYSVSYSLEDKAYIAECLELGIMTHGDIQESAIAKNKEASSVYLLMLEEDGEEILQPVTLQNTQIS